jgi:hypothetical protein
VGIVVEDLADVVAFIKAHVLIGGLGLDDHATVSL